MEMRKIFAAIAAMLCLMLFLFPYAFSEETDAMTELRSRISIDNVLKTEQSVSVVRIFYDERENEIFSEFVHAGYDEEGNFCYVHEDSDGNVEILSENGCVGFDAWSVDMYVPVFLMDEYDENIKNLRETFFGEILRNERIVSDTPENGRRIVTAENCAEEEGMNRRVTEYAFDEADGRLLEITESYRLPDGGKELYSRSFVTYNGVYEESEAFLRIRQPDNTREIEVVRVTDDGLETEIFVLPSDISAAFIYPEEYTLYSDETLTHMFVGEEKDENGLYPEKTTVYIGALE